MALSRQDVADYLQDNWDEVRLAVIERFVEELCWMTPEQAVQKLLRGNEVFGPFELNTIPAAKEFHQEVVDCCVYQAFLDLQHED